MLPDFIKSDFKFRSIYSGYLINLLKKDFTVKDLGILVLLSAHASFDEDLYKVSFKRLCKIYKSLQSKISAIDEKFKNDDYHIAKKIIETGWENIHKVYLKKLNNLWHIQYNQLRTLKPRRNATLEIKSVYKKFEKNSFNFNKSFLQIERFMKRRIAGTDVSFFYNKFPFVKAHTLLVPEQEKNHPQFLRRRFHFFACDLAKGTEGFAIGYNSIGAFASVNHLHFQLFIKNETLPVENSMWKHNGGEKKYPAECFAFTNKTSSWKFIQLLHKKNIPYNILYTRGKIYIFPVNFQKIHKHTIFPLGFAWIELSGSFINVSKKDYDRITEKQILKEFKMNKFPKKLPLK